MLTILNVKWPLLIDLYQMISIDNFKYNNFYGKQMSRNRYFWNKT
jgi:hypothetical protein